MNHQKLIQSGLLAFGIGTASFAMDIGDATQIHGYASQGFLATTKNNYLISTSTNGSFEFNEMALTVSSKPLEKLRLGLQVFARDMGTEGNGEVVIDWAFGDYRAYDFLGIRIGRFKTPIQLYNQVRDIDVSRVPIILPQSVYNDDIRENSLATDGVDIYGNIALPNLGDIDYDVYGGGVNIAKRDVRFSREKNYVSGSGMAQGMANAPMFSSVVYSGTTDHIGAFDRTYGLRAAWNTPLNATLGGSFVQRNLWEEKKSNLVITTNGLLGTIAGQQVAITIPNHTDITMYSFGGFLDYTLENLNLAGEVDIPLMLLEGTANLNDMTKFGAPPNSTMNIADTIQGLNFYGLATYRLFDWLSIGAYYSATYNDISDMSGDSAVIKKTLRANYQAYQQDICQSLRFDINSNWIFKAEIHEMIGAASVLAIDNNLAIPEKNWIMGAIRATYQF